MCWTDGWLQPSAHSGAGIVNGWWTARLGRDTHTHTHTHTHSRLRTITCTPTCTHTFTPNGVFRGCLKLNWQGLSATVRCILASSCHTYIISHTQAHTHTHTVKVNVGDGSDSVVGLWFRLASSRLYFCLSLSPRCSQHNSDRRVCVVRMCVWGKRNYGKRIYLSIHLSILL